MITHWQNVLRESFGIDTDLERLDGEFDLNFRGSGIVMKVMRAGCEPAYIRMQIDALKAIRAADPALPVTSVRATPKGKSLATGCDRENDTRLLWVQDALEGVAYARLGPQPCTVIERLGELVARLNLAMRDFEHDQLSRETKWDLTRGGWIRGHLDTIEDAQRRDMIGRIVDAFEELKPLLNALPQQAIHNDLNDYNILLKLSASRETTVSGIIDFGDMIAAPRVCELAIAGAYVVLEHDRPEAALAALVRGYHRHNPLTEDELALIWPLLRMRLAVSVVNSTIESRAKPDDPYVTISQAPAWRFLERNDQDIELATARLRIACDLPAVPSVPRIKAWLANRSGTFAPIIGVDLASVQVGDLSVAGSTVPRDPFAIDDDEAARLGTGSSQADAIWLGRYGEPRLIYTEPAFRQGASRNADRRSVHLGIDVFAPAGTPIRAPLTGRVVKVEHRSGRHDYGGVVVLDHETDEGDRFQALYGHLDRAVCENLTPGRAIGEGELIGHLGECGQNGGWLPHLHFQVALAGSWSRVDMPGVAYPDEFGFWENICPNPAALLNVPETKAAYRPIDEEAIMAGRHAHFADNLRLSYTKPLLLLRGWRHHLFDEMGRTYLDAYNNVPHVGHAHPRIQAVCADQLTRLNTNTRYLHPAQMELAETILAKMPKGLDKVFMVNSGSEANELALRIARNYSGGRDIITPEHGYHGITTGAIAISSYKFAKPGGGGQRDWVHLVDVADDYRGRFRRNDSDRATKFAGLVDGALTAINGRGGRLAGFIAETFPSVGGQIIPPEGYLRAVYEKIRAAGGVCIADEVQTGLGRLGEFYFGFEQQRACPDIVVLGKPIGNGHPIGIVVTTDEIASSFARGPEFFSTFGGSTLSCRIAKTVLDIVDEEGLQENARLQGVRLLDGLTQLKESHEIVGDVRSIGLFTGIELVADRQSLAPATDAAGFVMNALREKRILIGREGPADNILKIRPPLTIDATDIDLLIESLDECFKQAEFIVGSS